LFLIIVVFGLLVWSSTFNPKIPKFICGLLISLFAIFILLCGDKKLNIAEGRMGRLFFPPKSSDLNSKLQKIAVGLVVLYVGASLMLSCWGY